LPYNNSLPGDNMAAYSKEFLIDCFMSRFLASQTIDPDSLANLEQIAIKHYDKVGRDKFRISASLDADAIRKFKLESLV
jgi:hypothetical protein